MSVKMEELEDSMKQKLSPFSPTAAVFDWKFEEVKKEIEDNRADKASFFQYVPRKLRFKQKVKQTELWKIDQHLGTRENLSMSFKLSMEGGLKTWVDEWLFKRWG